MKCLYCNKTISGRLDKKFCDQYCKSAFHYQNRKEKESLYFKIDSQLKKNRTILKYYNKAGKAYVRKQVLLEAGFNPRYFTHYWKNGKGQVYLFCYEYGFSENIDNGKTKYILITYQNYMM